MDNEFAADPCASSAFPYADASSAPTDATGAPAGKPQTCRRCGQPRKGHTCPNPKPPAGEPASDSQEDGGFAPLQAVPLRVECADPQTLIEERKSNLPALVDSEAPNGGFATQDMPLGVPHFFLTTPSQPLTTIEADADAWVKGGKGRYVTTADLNFKDMSQPLVVFDADGKGGVRSTLGQQMSKMDPSKAYEKRALASKSPVL